MHCSTPGLPVHRQLLEFTQTHGHWVSDAIQPSHPLSSPSPPAFNLSQHQGLFKWISSSHQVAKVLEFQLQYQFFQRIFRTDFFRMDWLDLHAVQATLKSLLQHHSSKLFYQWQPFEILVLMKILKEHVCTVSPSVSLSIFLEQKSANYNSRAKSSLSSVFANKILLEHKKKKKHQFFSTQLSSEFDSHIHTWLLEKP